MSDNENVQSPHAVGESTEPDEISDNNAAPAALTDAAAKPIDFNSVADEFAQQFRRLSSECKAQEVCSFVIG